MLEVIGLECVRGQRTLFSNLSFSLSPGELLQVTGTNGSGKTSLLRLLCGLARPTAGEILWNRLGIHALAEDFNSVFVYLGHRPAVKDELTVIENLRFSCRIHQTELSFEDARQVLEAAGLQDFESHPARLLSDGLRRRLALAGLLVRKATLWLLDETLTSLDSFAAAWITDVMGKHLAHGGMIVLATHQSVNVSQPVRSLHLA